MRLLLLLSLMLLGITPLSAQRLGIGYYDLDGLYDTSPSRFYDDEAYTPEGRREWTQERYDRKVKNIAAVIDSMALDVVGLYGVEHQGVVHDIAKSCTLDYTYIHCTRNSFDGQDFALLYFGDKFFIDGFDGIDSRRNMVAITGTLFDDSPITIILSRSGDDLLAYLDEEEHNELVVVLGKLYQDEIERMGYTNTLQAKERRGEGNYALARGYVMHDRIATNNIKKILKSGVFITPWLLTPNRLSPLPTFDGDSYVGGYSKYLPIFTYIF
ncbi:MAG: hypothetical protein SNI51_09240 [Rikenellaceae bacterium]